MEGGWTTVRVAGALVTLPATLETVTSYRPEFATVTEGSERLAPVAPPIGAKVSPPSVLWLHW